MKKVCIVLNKDQPKYSETFLKAHIDNLASTVLNIYNYLPYPEVEFQSSSDRKKIPQVARRQINNYGQLRLKRFLKRNQIEIVLAEYGHVGALITNICRRLNLPLIVHFHGFDAYNKAILEQYEALYKGMFEYAHALIAVSKDMREQLIRLGADPAKIHLNACGADIEMFSLARPENSPPHLLAIGRFVEKKAPYLTILAFQKTVNQVPGAKLTMVGDGELFEVCEKIVQAYHLQGVVELKKEVPHEEVARLMQSARAYVQHSLVPASGDSEGTPVTILEAGASGLPVISTQHAGIKDVVLHEKTGFLVEEGDIDTMSEYMYVLLTEPTKAQKMGENAKKFISDNFNLQKSISVLKHIIENT